MRSSEMYSLQTRPDNIYCSELCSLPWFDHVKCIMLKYNCIEQNVIHACTATYMYYIVIRHGTKKEDRARVTHQKSETGRRLTRAGLQKSNLVTDNLVWLVKPPRVQR